MISKKISSILILFFGFFTLVNAQDILSIHGSVREKETTSKMDGVSIIITKDGVEFTTEYSSSNGKFDFELPLGYRYNLKFTKKDYVHKIIQFDSKNIPAEDMEGGFDYPLEITLFKMVEGMNMAIFDQPIGKAKFDSEKNAIEFDHDYTAIMQQKIDDELDRLENMEFDTKQRQKDFDLLVERGDDKAAKEKYPDALEKYQQALKIFPNDEPVKQKIADVQAKIDEVKKGKEDDAAYSRLVSDGNSFMKKQEWKKAKSKYEKALEIKPDESEPQDRIREINKLLENLMNRDQYNDLVDQGDRKMQSEDYALAIEKYEAAIKLIPTEDYPRDQIVKAQGFIASALADKEAQMALDKNYDDKIALADSNFSNKRFVEARDLYLQAQKLKPEEKRPPKQIEAIDALLAKKEEQDAKDKERNDVLLAQQALDALYQSIIDEGNVLYNSDNLEDAKEKYELALTHKPKERYPISKIQDIEKRLEEMEANAKKEAFAKEENAVLDKLNQEYQALIDEAEDLLVQEKLEESILKFEESLEVKPSEKLPKSKIIFIRKLIEARQKSAEENDRLADIERKKNEDAEKKSRLEEESRLKREAQEELLAEQKRKKEEEEERKRQEAEDLKNRKGSLLSEVDTSREKEVERFYRDAKLSSETAKGNKIDSIKDKINSGVSSHVADAKKRREDNAAGITNRKDRVEQVYRDGNNDREIHLIKVANQQESFKYKEQDIKEQAFMKREHNENEINNKRVALADNTSETYYRQERIIRSNEQKAGVKFQNEVNARQGEVGRLDNQFEIERKRNEISNRESISEDIRLERVNEVGIVKDRNNQSTADVRYASRVKQDATKLGIAEKKKQEANAGASASLTSLDNASAIERKKQLVTSSLQENQLAAKLRRLDSLEKRKGTTEGSPTDERNYKLLKGYEDIPEGITETSYKIGTNKDVIERTVKIGNKVDVYRKVISKYGTAYFKNNHSITKNIWIEETVRVTD